MKMQQKQNYLNGRPKNEEKQYLTSFFSAF